MALAGGVGAVLRALLIHHVGLRRADPLPVGTMVVNASGSLVLGVLTGLSLYHGLGPHVLAVVGVGLCGGYTTWSTASWETVHLVRAGHRPDALLYTLGGLAVCLGGGRRRHRPHGAGSGSVLEGLRRRAGADKVAVAVRLVDPGHRRPVLRRPAFPIQLVEVVQERHIVPPPFAVRELRGRIVVAHPLVDVGGFHRAVNLSLKGCTGGSITRPGKRQSYFGGRFRAT